MAHASKKAVLTAIFANGIVTVIKFGAALLSGSAAMMNESVHSVMDTLNQIFLLLGLREAEKPADHAYAFGHGQKKYLWNLWSAIGLFSIGAGVGLSHAWHSWHNLGHTQMPELVSVLGRMWDPFHINLLVLAIGFVLEGYSFVIAFVEFLSRMKRDGVTNPFRYLFICDDPTLVAIVLEDSVAMIGLVFAALGVSLSRITGHQEIDVIFSALIALMLGVIAFYLGWTNMRFLADMRDSRAEEIFHRVAMDHREVERCHDLRSIVIDEHHTVIVAEIELREEAIVPGLHASIVEKRDEIIQAAPPGLAIDDRLREYAADRAAVEATLARTEQIIDQIEEAVRAELPRVSHITVEVEGIGPRESINRD